ncbi:hypothetical protein DQ04_22951000, partial [Trypanosoma grayi]|uniref:hypothetical protein n=1 Tax=Trypanosoma grayi TaxID=71804 RepID=UPI0004F4B875
AAGGRAQVALEKKITAYFEAMNTAEAAAKDASDAAGYATDAFEKAKGASRSMKELLAKISGSLNTIDDSQRKSLESEESINNAVSRMKTKDYSGAVPLCESAAESAEAAKALAQRIGAEAAETIRFARDALQRVNESATLADEATKKAADAQAKAAEAAQKVNAVETNSDTEQKAMLAVAAAVDSAQQAVERVSSIKERFDALEQNAQLAVGHSGVVMQCATDASRDILAAKEYAQKVVSNAQMVKVDGPKALAYAQKAAGLARKATDALGDVHNSIYPELERSQKLVSDVSTVAALLDTFRASATRA